MADKMVSHNLVDDLVLKLYHGYIHDKPFVLLEHEKKAAHELVQWLTDQTGLEFHTKSPDTLSKEVRNG